MQAKFQLFSNLFLYSGSGLFPLFSAYNKGFCYY